MRWQNPTRALPIVSRRRRAGIAVIAATLIAAIAVMAFAGTSAMKIPAIVFDATLLIAAVGFADDVRRRRAVRRAAQAGHRQRLYGVLIQSEPKRL
jgi:UDP-N-acetylmuramyl pentapeptide phosphotransferase/UDP-N-acetylglucosamine-1-phosphate transferase